MTKFAGELVQTKDLLQTQMSNWKRQSLAHRNTKHQLYDIGSSLMTTLDKTVKDVGCPQNWNTRTSLSATTSDKQNAFQYILMTCPRCLAEQLILTVPLFLPSDNAMKHVGAFFFFPHHSCQYFLSLFSQYHRKW